MGSQFTSSITVPLKASFFSSSQVDKVLLTRVVLHTFTPQPLFSHSFYFLSVIVVKLAELLHRPLSVRESRPVEWSDVGVSPGPQFGGFFSGCFSRCQRCLENGAGAEAPPLPDVHWWARHSQRDPVHRQTESAAGRGGRSATVLLFSFCRLEKEIKYQWSCRRTRVSHSIAQDAKIQNTPDGQTGYLLNTKSIFLKLELFSKFI